MNQPADPSRTPAMVPPGRVRLVRAELRAWRPTLARLLGLLRSAVTSFVVLAGMLWLMPGVDAYGLSAVLWLVVLVACVGALLRPLLLALATVLGGLGAMVVGASVQTIVMYVALRLAPDAKISGLPAAFVASWIAAVLATLVDWLTDSGTDDVFVGAARRVMRRVRRAGGGAGTPAGGDGLLVVQLDGVSAPLIQWAVRTGNLPTIGRWLRSRSHQLRTWHTGMPATTPAAQAGILHGDVRSVPAFRWYEKQSGRLMVTNRPQDAAVVERRLSDGHGLLRDGGVSISNVFSGDAPTTLFTISRAALPGRSTRGYASFMTYGFSRAIVLGLGRVLKELHQARAQRLRDIRPRVGRSGAFLALRPLAGMLRDVNVSLIAEQMALGTPVIFCDFVDYDEVAHHAGPARPEAMEALGRLDGVLGIIERLSAGADRRYHLVVLSDHGQSQGATFRQRFGEPLARVVDRLVRTGATAGGRTGRVPAQAATADVSGAVEPWGPVNTLLTEITARRGVTAASTRAAVRSRTADREVTLGPAGEEARRAAGTEAESVVVASGNLAMVYLTRHPGKLNRAEIDAAYPGLVSGLAAHSGIGVVVVGGEAGPVAVGDRGEHHLRDGRVDGTDPLAGYGPFAAADLLRHQEMDHVGDLVLISTVDPVTEEVTAFEELVGSHGGLGGWQTDAFLLHPADWPVTEDPLIGPASVHRQLVAWQHRLRLRADTPPDRTVEPARDAMGGRSDPGARTVEPARDAMGGRSDPGARTVEPARDAMGGRSDPGARTVEPARAAKGGRSDPGAAPEQADELCDGQYQGDRDQDALPGLGKDGAADDADTGVDHRPQHARRRVRPRETPPVQTGQRDGEQHRNPAPRQQSGDQQDRHLPLA
ncbi:alkaline phosphatase family protein [Plantactinospora mayteni]|uniref:alkaline phosphatase family protein n=2 Tax=Plantactinospora mayteni TaxID=566021 RepID=UPI003CD06FDF